MSGRAGIGSRRRNRPDRGFARVRQHQQQGGLVIYYFPLEVVLHQIPVPNDVSGGSKQAQCLARAVPWLR